VDGLKTALRTRAHSFVLRFIKQGGLGSLLDALQRAPRDDAVTRHNLIAAIKALMNNSVSTYDLLTLIPISNYGLVETYYAIKRLILIYTLININALN
jgi:hypothetical protein